MRAVVQKVTRASVVVENQTVGSIGQGLLVYLGVTQDDDDRDATWIAEKIALLRIFPDDQGKMNRSVQDIAGAVLLVSQFTLYGDCRKGRRPGFDQAARLDIAETLYRQTIATLESLGLPVQTGRFGAHMEVHSLNDGPVTFLLDSHKQF